MNKFKLILLCTILLNFQSCDEPEPDLTPEILPGIGAEGGTIESSDAIVQLSIPKNALSKKVDIKITKTTDHAAGNLGPVYDFTPDGQQFSTPVSITFTYAEGDLAGANENYLVIAYEDGGKWVPIVSQVDIQTNKITGETDHFTKFGIVEQIPKIGADGGTVQSKDTKVVLTIPENALSTATEIEITETTEHIPGNLGSVYDFTPDGLQFDSPVSIVFSYSEEDLGEVDESNLVIAYEKDGSWEPIPSQIDIENNQITGTVDHFTKFTIVEKQAGVCRFEKFTSISSIEKRVDSLIYDSDGKVTEIQVKVGPFNPFSYVFTYEDGKIISVDQSNDNFFDATFTYEGELLSRVTLPVGAYFEYSYNDAGQIISQREIYEGETLEEITYQYDENGNIISTSDYATFEYDQNKNPFSLISIPAPILAVVVKGPFGITSLSSQNNFTRVAWNENREGYDPTIFFYSNYQYDENGYAMSLTAAGDPEDPLAPPESSLEFTISCD